MSDLVSELKIPARPEFVSIARITAASIATRLPFSPEAVEDIKVAVSEACANAVQYAYNKKNKTAHIQITLTQQTKALEIVIADQGTGFDVKNPPRRPIKDDDIHMGLGLVFMKNLMDEVTIKSEKNKGTIVTLVKRF